MMPRICKHIFAFPLSVWIIITSVLSACTYSETDDYAPIDSLNNSAFCLRYVDIDSSLSCAKQAFSLAQANRYSDGIDYARNNLAFVAYQQMKYDKSLFFLNQVFRSSKNQLELLCADVMYMKVAQRTDQGIPFFSHRNQALSRIKRIQEDLHQLTPAQQNRFYYAQSEMHIISSTYYYYYGQIPQAIDEINQVPSLLTHSNDSVQWTYYRYMLGSGGLIKGSPQEVALQEFDHLFSVYSYAQSRQNIYFLANTLQSFASLLSQPQWASYIESVRPNVIHYLKNNYTPHPLLPTICEEGRLAQCLAQRAIQLFASYKDLFQVACAHRTMGEIYFRYGQYTHALKHFTQAYQLVQSQKQRSQWGVPFWIAGIHEKLSMAYSALNQKSQSDFHRNAYLQYLEEFSQDYEKEEHKLHLQESRRDIRIRLYVLIGLIGLTICLLIFLLRHIKTSSWQVFHSLSTFHQQEPWTQLQAKYHQVLSFYEESLNDLSEAHQTHLAQISRYRETHIESKAKTSLAYAIIPYMNRLTDALRRMRPSITSGQTLAYASELIQEIMHINQALTKWIQIKQGLLRLRIVSFPLQDLFDILSSSKWVYEQKGIQFSIHPTTLKVKADKTLTLFMLNTLCDNARKFTPSGGQVTVEACAYDEYVEISITDTGEGLTPHDVELLSSHAVYDPSLLSNEHKNKGFGFGIMNCKGIIQKYLKTSSLFSVCRFGVESEPHRGSRFWFRLPIVSLFVAFFSFSHTLQATPSSQTLCDSICQANVKGHYAQAYAMGQQALQQMNLLTDTLSAIYILNEMAVASLALKQWDNYQECNTRCKTLFHLYTADNSLTSYCNQMQQLNDNSVILYAMLVSISLVLLLLLYRLFLHPLLTRDTYERLLFDWLCNRVQQHCVQLDSSMSLNYVTDSNLSDASLPSWASHVSPSVCNLCNRYMADMQQMWEQIREQNILCQEMVEKNRALRFVEDRLYVTNQVIDNCLSTLKHETMYFPARIHQLLELANDGKQEEGLPDVLSELDDLVQCYLKVYTILHQQAERQLEENFFQRQSCLLSDYHATLPSYSVQADAVLLNHLIQLLEKEGEGSVAFSAYRENNVVHICVHYPQMEVDASACDQLFSPTTESFTFQIIKQIIREHDSQMGHPGLRLFAELTSQGLCIHFTLLSAPVPANQNLNNESI